MPPPKIDLAAVLAPIETETFYETHLNRTALYVEGTETKFAGLLDWSDINDIITYSQLNMGGFRLVYEKNNLPATELNRYEQWLEKGATLIINSLDQHHPAVYHLANALELELNTNVNINCYVSYPAKQGFDTHFDLHDVFVIQVTGRKTWTVFEPTLLHPTHLMSKPDLESPTENPYLERSMSTGDMMYIPRGHWHHALAETPSVHLTVGPGERTPIHFLHNVLEKLLYGDEWFRRDFPLAAAAELAGHREGLKAHFEEFRTRATELLGRDALFEAFIEYIQTANNKRSTGRVLPDLWTLENSITPDMTFRFIPLQKAVIRYDEQKKFGIVYLRGKPVHLDGVSAQTLSLIFESNTAFDGQMLMEYGNVSWEKAKSLLLTMYRQAIIVRDDVAH